MTPKLDLWELLVVRHCKTNNPSLGILKRILAKRCMLDVSYIEMSYVATYLLDILIKFDLMNSDSKSFSTFIMECKPSESWKFEKLKTKLNSKQNEDYNYFLNIINVLVSRIRYTEVQKFNNYKPRRIYMNDTKKHHKLKGWIAGIYKDGGTIHYKFSNGFECYKNNKIGSKHIGRWFYEYPSNNQIPMNKLPEEYKQIIVDLNRK